MPRQTAMRILNSKRKRRLAALAILSAIAVVLLASRILLHNSETVAAESIRASATANTAQGDRNIPIIVVTWPVEVKRDPFIWEVILPPKPSDSISEAQIIRREAGEKIHLQAILYGEEASRAIINGQIRQQGQLVDGFSIQRIERGRIVIAKSGVEVEIDL